MTLFPHQAACPKKRVVAVSIERTVTVEVPDTEVGRWSSRNERIETTTVRKVRLADGKPVEELAETRKVVRDALMVHEDAYCQDCGVWVVHGSDESEEA